MTTEPDLQFRRLTDAADFERLDNLTAVAGEENDPRSVSFGLPRAQQTAPSVEKWGLFIRGSLSGAVWVVHSPGAWSVVEALYLARAWWNSGLASWMLEELARNASLAGATGMIAVVRESSPGIGETLDDAGFSRPGADEETYPVGEWRRLIVRINNG